VIICAQCFFNEVDLLEIKCNELAGLVDLFVVIEANLTFTGIPKPLHFRDNQDRFKDFPMRGIALDLPTDTGPAGTSKAAWKREDIHRQTAARITSDIAQPEDVIIWVDADETPRRERVQEFIKSGFRSATLEMDYLPFYFDRVNPDLPWTHPKIYRKGFTQFFPQRYEPQATVVKDAGWHFEYFGARDFLLSKVDATSHGPDPEGRDFYKRVAAGEQPGLERTVPYPIERLPKFVRDNRERFAPWFHPTAS
jgi:hypothetical protein